MKLRLWPRRPEPEPEPEPEAPVVEAPPKPEPIVEPEPAPPAPDAEPPAKVSLTLAEAKETIRATAAARAQLCEVIAKRLRDRKLLAPDGVFELREDASA